MILIHTQLITTSTSFPQHPDLNYRHGINIQRDPYALKLCQFYSASKAMLPTDGHLVIILVVTPTGTQSAVR